MKVLAVIGLVVAAVAAFAVSRGPGPHTLRAAFTAAVQVVPGQEVRIAGRKIGHVGGVRELDGDAIVDLRIDAAAWPLRRGTIARLRYGSVSGYAGRFVELDPGPAAAPVLPDGGVLSTAATITPVEFDQVFNTFDAPARRDLRGLLDNGADAVDGHDLGGALAQGSGGLDDIADVFADLGAEPAALRQLVTAGANTTAGLREQAPALRGLLTHAAGTIDELAAHTRAEQASLVRLPAALHAGQHTLGHLDASLDGLRPLLADLGPGARALRDTAPSVRRTTAALLGVAPLATSTLSVGQRTAPAIDTLLQTATPFLPQLGGDLRRLAPMLGCVRPYAPEIAGMAETWTGFDGRDADGAYGRVDLTQLPPTVAAGSLLTSQQITTNFANKVFYALPRPPGLDAGHPWLLPQCGAGKAAMDPSQDPER
jgi:phospholipid/cholesterol/gamma-HCH transport system substrate-binding protein